MKKRKSNAEDSAGLRQRAEGKIRLRKSEINKTISETDMLKLIHELEVQQIEVEMQNEELIHANEIARAATEKYEELYDFAPSGYYTLSRNGSIKEINLRGAQMLGKERSLLINSQFGFFIKEDSRFVFENFMEEVFRGKSHVNCELPLISSGNKGLQVHLTGIMSDTKEQCRITAIDITDRKEAEDELRKNLAKYKVLIDTFPIAITISDPTGKIIETNAKALELLGLSREEHLNRKLKGEEWTIIKPDGTIFPQDEYPSVKALKENRLVENVEMGIVKTGEEITWLNVTAAPIPIEDHGVMIAYNDTTRRRQMESALLENEERLRLALQATNDVVWDWDIVNDSQQWNEAGKKVFGWTQIGDNTVNAAWWMERIHPDDRKRVEDGFDEVVKTKSGIKWQDEYRFRKADGTYAEVLDRGNVLRDNTGKPIRMIGAMMDITERRKAEKLVKENEHKFRTVADFTSDLEYWQLPDGQLNYISPSCERITGYSRSEFISNPDLLVKMVHPDDLTTFIKHYNLENTDNSDFFEKEINFRIIKKDSTLIWIEHFCRAVFDDNNNYLGIRGSFRDITERKNAEMALIESELLAHSIANTTPALLFLYDFENEKNIWTNEAHKRFFEHLKKDSSHLDFTEISQSTHPDDFRGLKKLADETLNNTSINQYEIELRLKWKDSWKWMKLFVSVFKRDSNGKLIQILGALFDIDDQKKTEQDLLVAKEKAEESEVKYRLLYDSNQMPISIFEADSLKFLSVNNAMAQKYGYTKEEFLTMTILDIRPESEITKVKQAVSVMDKGLVNAGIFLHKRKNGEIIQVEIIRCEIIFEGKRAKLVFANDVTDRLKMEQELLLTTNKLQIAKEKAEENEEYFRNIFENSAVGKSITGLDGSIKTNKAFSQMLGYPFEEFQTININGITHPDDIQKTKDAFDTLLNGEKTQVKFEKRYIHKNGSIVFADEVSSLQKDRNGNALFFITSVNDITERKLNEEKLIKSEERYALGIEASEQGIWDWNVETNEVFYSEQWKKQIGYADDELKNEFNTWIEHLHPDEKEYCQNAVQAYLNHPVEHFVLDFRFRHKDGTYRWIHNKAASLKNKEGKVVRLFGTHTDFTESKLSEAIINDIIEKNPMSIQVLDMEGYPIQVNPAHTKLFGVEPPSDYSVFKDTQLLSLGFDKMFERIKKGEVVFFPDSYYNVHDIDPSFPDSPVWVKALGFTLNDNNGIPNKIVLMHENITARKNADALLNDIIENNPMSIQVVDKEGHTVRGNPAFIQLFGSAPPPGFSIFDDLKSKSVELANLVARVKNGEIVHLPDIYFNTHDSVAEAPDIPLWIRALIFPLKDSAGKPERFVFMHENITERKLYEAEIHKLNEELEQRVTDRTAQLEAANKELEAFSYSVSHDLRTPLRALNGFATFLTEDYSIVLDDEGKRLLSVISENATKMGFLIDDLLSFSRLGRIEIVPTPINMKTMAMAVYKELVPETDKDKIRFTLHNLPAALGDSSMIKQVWVNLIGNAIKFTSKKTGRHIEIGVIAGENENIYFVKDNGAGFEMAHAQKLFGVFQRLHTIKEFDGIGAGLAIVRRIILRHNGRVWAEGSVNEGATFYFTLPLIK